jgi:thioredoxin-like negative regulator of GroEL
MIERIIILVVLIALSMIAYRAFNLWKLRRINEQDQLFTHFAPGKPGVVLFTAEYCYPCITQQKPAIHRLVEQIGEKAIQVIEVDVEKNPEVAQRWGVLSLPTTFILDRDGKPRDINHGVTSTEKLKRQLELVG